MTSRLASKAALGLSIAVVMLFATATAASATVYSYNVELTDGTITVGTTAFVTPGTVPATCPGSTGITGTIDTGGSTTATDNITGSLNIGSGDFAAPFTTGRFKLTATGVATGTNRGNFNHATETFTGLTFPTIAFTVRSINTTTCVVGTVVCAGTATLTISGGIVNATSLPLAASDEVYVNSTAGSILTTSGCGFPWFAVVFPTASLSIGPNAGSGDPGAIFHQL